MISGELHDISQFKNIKIAANSLMCFNTVITNCTKIITSQIHKNSPIYSAIDVY